MLSEAIGIFLALYCIWFYFENFYNKNGYAPGPIRFPPFGNMIQIAMTDKIGHVALHKLSKKYGDVMSLKLGLRETVLCSSNEAWKHVLARDETAARDLSGLLYDRNFGKNIGLVMSEGPVWAATNKFCRESLRKYGFGSRVGMQNLFLDETVELFKFMEQDFKSNPKNRLHIHSDYFHRVTGNIMSTLLMGKRYDYSDPEFQNILKFNNDFIKSGPVGAGLILAYPFIRHIFPKAVGYDIQMRGIRGHHNIAKKHLRERKELGEYKHHPISLTDDFLRKMDAEANVPKPLYTEDHYAVIFSDLIQGGTETSSNTLNWILIHLTVFPKIQENVYQEISSVIGSNRTLDLQDKSVMPYTQAVMLEALRWSRATAFPRKAIETFTYRNITIPKGTIIMGNMHSNFFDEDIWGDPQVFRPERFIDDTGNIDDKLSGQMSFAFGGGPKVCFGEVLARDSLFILLTSLIQRYKFTLAAGSNPSLEPIVGLTLYMEPYDAIVTRRNN